VKIFLDECLPEQLACFLASHDVQTSRAMGWKRLKDGPLLQRVEGRFDAFLTCDKNLRYQQNLDEMQVAILVLPTNSWPKLRNKSAQIAAAAVALQPGQCVELVFL